MDSIKNRFATSDLFELAMTHRSWINENPNVRPSNERLEFLGDAILEFVISEHIYREFPDKEEGFLTSLRANMVNTKNLAVVAANLNLGKEILLSKGEEQGNGRENESLLADTLEALIGAIFLDQGIEAAREFIRENVLKHLPEKLQEPLKDAKSRLQEAVQAQGFSTPKYRVVRETGPDHNKEFEVEVIVGENPISTGVGKSKSRAEQTAADAALANFHKSK